MSVKKNLIDQKEYLKKYLSGDKKKKKKKDKKHKAIKATVKIIDDDIIDLDNNDIDEELLVTGEDAPQIVGEVIEADATAPKVVKWRSIAIKDEPEDGEIKIKQEKPDNDDMWGRKATGAAAIKDEFSPQRRKIKVEPNTEEKHNGKNKKKNHAKHSSDSDLSPARRCNRAILRNGRYDSDSDLSLPRNRKRGNSATDSDMSLPRRRANSSNSDLSPPRRREMNVSTHRKNGVKRERRDSDSDYATSARRRRANSPQGRRIQSPVLLGRSPPRKREKTNLSPARKQNNPFRREIEAPRRCDSNTDATPPHAQMQGKERNHLHNKQQASRARDISMSPPPTHKPKATKTLDGKRAGLQEAQALKAENEERRRAEERLFENMSKEVSGRDAEIAVRNSGRKGRRAREAQEEDPEERRRREKREQEKKEIYDRWGKGLKQVEDRRLQLENEAYESSKPLARYSNDADLDRHLREQERAEDPMLEYMRKKKREQATEDNIPVMPKYEGTYPENRFSIPPGYRWDGVDRSNGYEKRWFDVRNEKRALEDEAYKYSVEDM